MFTFARLTSRTGNAFKTFDSDPVSPHIGYIDNDVKLIPTSPIEVATNRTSSPGHGVDLYFTRYFVVVVDFCKRRRLPIKTRS